MPQHQHLPLVVHRDLAPADGREAPAQQRPSLRPLKWGLLRLRHGARVQRVIGMAVIPVLHSDTPHYAVRVRQGIQRAQTGSSIGQQRLRGVGKEVRRIRCV